MTLRNYTTIIANQLTAPNPSGFFLDLIQPLDLKKIIKPIYFFSNLQQ
jgi:hypothetical protein